MKLFVRPNSGGKLFTGFVVTESSFDAEIHNLEHSISSDELILISSPQIIYEEYRFVVVNKKIVAGSTYIEDSRPTSGKQIPEEITKIAQSNLNECLYNEDIESVFTIDYALTPHELAIVEINSFSSAALYSCNLEDVVREVSAAAIDDYEDLNSIPF